MQIKRLRVHNPSMDFYDFEEYEQLLDAARVIQQLAGHSELTTTQRYMHLSPGASEAAIAMLETPPPRRDAPARGDMLETASRRPPHTPQFQ